MVMSTPMKEKTDKYLAKYKRIWPLVKNNKPHKSWRGWRRYISLCCEVRGSYRGVTFFGTSNCNYIIFPDGMLLSNYGFHGQAMMHDIKTKGVYKAQDQYKKESATFKGMVAEFDRLKAIGKE